MADEEIQVEGAPAASGGSRKLQLIIVAVLMIGEGAGVYFVTNALSDSPVPALAEDVADDDAEGSGLHSDDYVEVELAECRPSNRMSGKFVTFHIKVSALVRADMADTAKDVVRKRQSRIADRVNFVVRSAEPKHFDDPSLQTIKRRIKHELAIIVDNDEMFVEILIPEILQSGGGV